MELQLIGCREIARYRDSKEKRSKLFWEIELLTVFTSIICIGIWGILIAFSKEFKIYFLILILNLINTMFDISWFYAGLEQFKYTIIQNSIFKVLGAVLIFVFIKQKSDLWLYFLIISSTSLMGTITMWAYLKKFIQKIEFKTLNIFSHFKKTLVYFIPTIATSIYTVLDKTLIGLVTNDVKENGYYEQASKIMNTAKALTYTSLNNVLESRISYLFIKKKYEEIRNRINQSMNYILFFGFGFIFGIIGVAKLFVPIFFGHGYEKVILILQLLSPLIIIIGISTCLGSQYYNPAGLRKKSTKFIIIGSVINLILNLILIPKFLSLGACIATIIAETIISILYLSNSNGFLTFKTVIKFSWRKLLAGIIMLCVIILISLLNINNYIVLILEVGIGFITYITVLSILKDESIKYVLRFVKEK